MPTAAKKLTARFAQGFGTAVAVSWPAELEARLSQLASEAHRAWPELAIKDDAFAEYIGGRLKGDRTPFERLEGLCGADLFLAQGCALGLKPALAEFDRHFLPAVREAVARLDTSGALTDEVEQLVRQRFLVTDGTALPRISEYAGLGPLRAWIRAAALRIGLDLLRQENKAAPLEEQDLNALETAAGDPEVDFIKDRYRPEFRKAFAEALERLDPRERTVLRMNVIDGLNIERIGALYQVHRATVARWIAGARETLLDETRRLLAERLRVDRDELDSIVTMVRSQLDISIVRFLKQKAD